MKNVNNCEITKVVAYKKACSVFTVGLGHTFVNLVMLL